MRPNLSSLVILLSACIAGAAPAPYPIDVNSRAQSAPAITCYRANSFTIRATYLDGQTASDLTGAIPFLSWATNTTAASVSTSSWAFAGSPTNGIVDFTFAPAAVNFTPGRYIYEVGVKTSNNVVSVYRQGVFFIVGSPAAAGVGAVDWTNLPGYISSEADPLAYPVATNALALASTALQPPATNGLLRAEADTLATVTARGATTTSEVYLGRINSTGGAFFTTGTDVSSISGDEIRLFETDDVLIIDGAGIKRLGRGWSAAWPTNNAAHPIATLADMPDVSGFASYHAATNIAAAAVAASPAWLYRTGLSGTVAFVNDAGRPQAWTGTGALTVSEFSGLQPPAQVYWTLYGFDSVTLPASTYVVGGGAWQANMVNHFTVWQVGTNVMLNFITATEVD